MPTRRPVAERADDGAWVLRARPQLAFTLDQAALAMALAYGGPPGRRVGPTSVPRALARLVELAVAGEDLAAPDTTLREWRDRLIEWEVWPDVGE